MGVVIREIHVSHKAGRMESELYSVVVVEFITESAIMSKAKTVLIVEICKAAC